MTRRRTSAGSECKPILSAQLGDILFESRFRMSLFLGLAGKSLLTVLIERVMRMRPLAKPSGEDKLRKRLYTMPLFTLAMILALARRLLKDGGGDGDSRGVLE